MQIKKIKNQVLCFYIFLILLHISRADYHCRRKGFGCKNGGICNRDGTCQCPQSRTGYDCSIDKGEANCDDNKCKNEALCYDQGKCLCSPDYYGDICQYKTVTSECLGTEITMNFVTPNVFGGSAYIRDAENDCTFSKSDAEEADYTKYSLTVPFNTPDNPCSALINQTNDIPQSGDISRFVDVIISYNPFFVSSTDSLIVYNCIHKGSNFTMFAELDDIGLDEKTNLKKDVQTTTYLPVRFIVIDKDNQPIEKPLFVGDIFKLLFYLSDTNVYESIMIDYCVANNTVSQGMVQFDFIKDGCPTDDGKNILVNSDGPVAVEFSIPGSNNKLPASELLLYAFKFKGTTNVGFNCAVRICKKGDEELCKPKMCSSSVAAEIIESTTARNTAPTTLSFTTPLLTNNTSSDENNMASSNANNISTNVTRRRRRSSGERQFLSTVLTVQEPPPLSEVLILPGHINHIQNQEEDDDDKRSKCALSQDILIVIVVMATIVFVLLVLTSILVVTLYRNKRREQLLKKRHSVDFHYTIPRPKLTEK